MKKSRSTPMAPTIGKYRPSKPKKVELGKKPGKGADFKKEKAANPGKGTT